MESHHAIVLGFGALVLLVGWLPKALAKGALSLPIVCVAIGFAVFSTPWLAVDLDHLRRTTDYEQLTEAVLLIALMGAGLKIDRRVGWVRWSSAWRLIGIGMPLMIALVLLVGHYGLALAWPAAVFLAGALTPTDPVLASDVAVGPPGKGEEGEVRFALTAEAALNDGLAFPVVLLGLAMAAGTQIDTGWIATHFIWRVLLAIVLGWSIGAGMGWLIFRTSHMPFSESSAGLVAVGTTAISFSLTEMAGGYGFVAVFLTAVALRAICPDNSFHQAMEGFAEQIERLLVMIVLVLFGGTLASGLLDALTLQHVIAAAVLLLIARPLSAWIALLGSPAPPVSRLTTAFFGIRGVGTLYYVVYATAHGNLPQADQLQSLIGAVVLGSILIHGLTSTPLMRRLDRAREESLRTGRYPEARKLTADG